MLALVVRDTNARTINASQERACKNTANAQIMQIVVRTLHAVNMVSVLKHAKISVRVV